MAKKSEFYKGRKKRKNYIIVPVSVIVGIVVLSVVLFYSMQKYAVITKDDVAVRPGILYDGSENVDESGNIVVEHETATATLEFDDADYSYLEDKVDGKVSELRAIFVPYENLNQEKIEEYASRLSSGNSLVLEMKPRSGVAAWTTGSSVASDYGLAVDNEVTQSISSWIEYLKSRGIYLVAQISCCIDERFTSYCTSVAIRNSLGNIYADESGYWLDPYSTIVRQYVIDLCGELYDMGFDEVVLADVRHPDTSEKETQLVYTKTLSTPTTPVNAVCGFARYVADALEDRPGKLSIYCYSPSALVRADETTGQDVRVFFKLYDRVYYITDKYAYTYNCEDVQSKVTVGKISDRMIPVVYNYLPDNTSWVLIDKEED